MGLRAAGRRRAARCATPRLDADLKGLRAENVSALALPVLEGVAEVTLSLRRNSLAIFRLIGLDFVSGERVLRKSLLADALAELHRLPRFGVEVFMNHRIIEERLLEVQGRDVKLFDVPALKQLAGHRC